MRLLSYLKRGTAVARPSFTMLPAALLVFSVLSGCDVDSFEAEEIDTSLFTPSYATGVFVDSPVANIAYTSQKTGETGFTNARGEFPYLPGDKIVFSIGGIEFPPMEIPATSIKDLGGVPVDFSPLQMEGIDDAHDPAAIIILRLLQSLDEDGNPDNGINISGNTHALAQGLSIDVLNADYDFDADDNVTQLLANDGGKVRVTALDAELHFRVQQGILEDFKPVLEISDLNIDKQNFNSELKGKAFFPFVHGPVDYVWKLTSWPECAEGVRVVLCNTERAIDMPNESEAILSGLVLEGRYEVTLTATASPVAGGEPVTLTAVQSLYNIDKTNSYTYEGTITETGGEMLSTILALLKGKDPKGTKVKLTVKINENNDISSAQIFVDPLGTGKVFCLSSDVTEKTSRGACEGVESAPILNRSGDANWSGELGLTYDDEGDFPGPFQQVGSSVQNTGFELDGDLMMRSALIVDGLAFALDIFFTFHEGELGSVHLSLGDDQVFYKSDNLKLEPVTP